ncbi:MAG: hypothetical protein WCW47_02855 [Candidatus Paceibacterota bacterium]|jgi:hypothetical protein
MTEYRTVAGPTISTIQIGGVSNATVTDMENPCLNKMVKEGWEIHAVITHHSINPDCTAIAFIMERKVEEE